MRPDDPWDTSPPPDETPAQRTAREKRELDAQKINDAIDDDIKRQRSLLKKDKEVIKILLVGQAHSGKSTTLKNFRLKYAPEDWEKERISWRSVVQLNLIRNILTIIVAMQSEMNGETPAVDIAGKYTIPLHFSDKHELLILRLASLRQTEVDLQRRLGAGSEEFRVKSSNPSPVDSPGVSRRSSEWAVRSWQDAIDSVNARAAAPASDGPATEAIASCLHDIKTLWTDETVQAVVRKHRVFSDDTSGFFLDDLDRVASRSYKPSDTDILRARLRTVGVQEHRLRFKRALDLRPSKESFGGEWVLYDVGGCRTQRAAWLPYFEGIHAVIFLAPVSCFDERLEEDSRINRLQDSLMLWESICSSQLLSKTTFILFLNKCDLLRKKMKTGISIKEFLTSYGDRPNDAKSFVKYLQTKFRDNLYQHSQHSPNVSHRNFYSFLTSVVDAKATSATLTSVQDGIFREHLSESNFL